MKMLFCILMITMVCLSGCATMMNLNIPGQTSADATLKSDIARMISMIEKSQAPKCKHRIVDTKSIGVDGKTVKEDWIVESCGKLIVYPVALTPDPKGGSYYTVTSPDPKMRYLK